MKASDLIGKTIVAATELESHKWDDAKWLLLSFSDDTACYIVGGYGSHTGESSDEYIQLVSIESIESVERELALFGDSLIVIKES